MPSFGTKSTIKLMQIDPYLQEILLELIEYYDFTIITGYRNKEEQDLKLLNGRTKVAWPGSKHNQQPSLAVDIAPWPIPYNWGQSNFKDLVKFYELAALVKYVAHKQGKKIRWGGDWDSDNDYKDQTFDDLLHFERGDI